MSQDRAEGVSQGSICPERTSSSNGDLMNSTLWTTDSTLVYCFDNGRVGKSVEVHCRRQQSWNLGSNSLLLPQ